MSTGNTTLVADDAGLKLIYCNGTSLALANDIWYAVKIDVNKSTGAISYYVGGEVKAALTTISASVISSLASSSVDVSIAVKNSVTSASASDYILLDNIAVASNDFSYKSSLNYNFQDQNIGFAPSIPNTIYTTSDTSTDLKRNMIVATDNSNSANKVIKANAQGKTTAFAQRIIFDVQKPAANADFEIQFRIKNNIWASSPLTVGIMPQANNTGTIANILTMNGGVTIVYAVASPNTIKNPANTASNWSPSSTANNIWYDVRIVVDRTTGNLIYYIDGVQCATIAIPATLTTALDPSVNTVMGIYFSLSLPANSTQDFYLDNLKVQPKTVSTNIKNNINFSGDNDFLNQPIITGPYTDSILTLTNRAGKTPIATVVADPLDSSNQVMKFDTNTATSGIALQADMYTAKTIDTSKDFMIEYKVMTNNPLGAYMFLELNNTAMASGRSIATFNGDDNLKVTTNIGSLVKENAVVGNQWTKLTYIYKNAGGVNRGIRFYVNDVFCAERYDALTEFTATSTANLMFKLGSISAGDIIYLDDIKVANIDNGFATIPTTDYTIGAVKYYKNNISTANLITNTQIIDGNILAEVTLDSSVNEVRTGTLALAVYKDLKLEGVSIGTTFTTKGTNKAIFSVPVTSTDSNYTVKAFMFENIDNLKPKVTLAPLVASY
jgi:hypothetical protein